MDFYLEEKICTLEELQELLVKWKNILGLNVWQISIQISSERELPVQGAQACVAVVDPIRTAQIHLLNPDDFDQDHNYNMEQALVHELLHVKYNCFAQFKHKSRRNLMYEQEVDHTATVLYKLNQRAEKLDEIEGSKEE